MKHRSRNNTKDQQNQQEYTDKLNNLFDISHANSNELIKNDEDRQFLKLQQESRTGCIGSVDTKSFLRDKRSAERKRRLLERATGSTESKAGTCEADEINDINSPELSIHSSGES